MDKNQINVFAPEAVAGLKCPGRRVNQPEVHNLDTRSGELLSDLFEIAFQSRFEPPELRPICIQADAKKAYATGFHSRYLTKQFLGRLEDIAGTM